MLKASRQTLALIALRPARAAAARMRAALLAPRLRTLAGPAPVSRGRLQ